MAPSAKTVGSPHGIRPVHIVILGVLVVGLIVFLLLPETVLKTKKSSAGEGGLKIAGNEAGKPLWGTIEDAPLDDEAVAMLLAAPTLSTFLAVNVDATPDGLAVLGHLSQLTSVNLRNVRCPGGSLEWTSRLHHLRTLICSECPWIDDAAIATLEKTPALTTIDLSGTTITDASLEWLSGIDTLTEISVAGCQRLTAEGLAQLANLPHLTKLDLAGVPMSSTEYRRLYELLEAQLRASPDAEPEIHQNVYSLTDYRPEWDQGASRLHAQIWDMVRLHFHRHDVTPETLRAFAPFTGVAELDFYNVAIVGGAFTAAPFDEITSVRLASVKFSAKQFEELSRWPQMEKLELWSVKLTDGEEVQLPDFPQLKTLSISSVKVGDAFMKDVSRCSELNYLRLSQTKLTDAGLAELAALTNLELFSLNHKHLTDESIVAIGAIKSLDKLEILGPYDVDRSSNIIIDNAGNRVVDAPERASLDLQPLSELLNLRSLKLYECDITDEGLLKLAGCPQLESLLLQNCPHVTPAGLEAFQQACPEVEIQ